jgi:hypothetical protein
MRPALGLTSIGLTLQILNFKEFLAPGKGSH